MHYRVHFPNGPRRHISSLWRWPAMFAVGMGAVLAFRGMAFPMPSTCVTSPSAGGSYVISICLSSPVVATTLQGDQSIWALAAVLGDSPGVDRLVFVLDGQFLLTDFESPYTFTLPTDRYIDGEHSIQVYARLKDGSRTPSAQVSVRFANGVTSPPVNTRTFTPSAGSPQASGQPFLVAAVGDGASGETNSVRVVSLLKAWQPNLFLYLGDVYERGSQTEFYNWYDASNSFGIFRTITNPTIGNHEYETGGARGYFDYWDNIPNFYSFDAGGWHFTSLNGNGTFNQTDPSSEQYRWLEQDLAAHPAPCTLAYFHQPAFSVGTAGGSTRIKPIWSLLARNGVDIVLNSNHHSYQRWVPLDKDGTPSEIGITQFVVGTGGHEPQRWARTDDRLAAGLDGATALGALRLNLSATHVEFAFINVDGQTLDSGRIECH